MKKLLYSALALFVVWFASTACFPIYVGPSRPEVPVSCPESSTGEPLPCDIAEPMPVEPTPTPTPAAQAP